MSSKPSMAMEPQPTELAANEIRPEADRPLECESIEMESLEAMAWVMANKPVGGFVAGWKIKQRFEDKTRTLAKSERCQVTSFCYPAGATLVEATVIKSSERCLED